MGTSIFPSNVTGVTVETATSGALSGDGSSGNKLAVGVDGTTIDVNGSNQLRVKLSGAADTQILFDNGGVVAGNAGLTFDKSTQTFIAGDNVRSQIVIGQNYSEFNYSSSTGNTGYVYIQSTVGNNVQTALIGESSSGDTVLTINKDDVSGHLDSFAFDTPNHTDLFLLKDNGTATLDGVLKTGGYQSSDGSAGVSAGPFTVITSITIKNGLIVAITGS